MLVRPGAIGRFGRARQAESAPALPSLFYPNMPLRRTGDSFSVRADNTDQLQWANFLAWGRFMIPSYGYHGISGSVINEPPGASPVTNDKDVLRPDRLSYFLEGADSTEAALAAIGINSYLADNTLSEMIDGFDDLVAEMDARGVAKILCTLPPAGTTSNPEPLNAHLRARTDLDLLVDVYAQYPGGSHTGMVDTGNGDQLHPNVHGGIVGGQALANALIAKGYELGAPYGATGRPSDNQVVSTVYDFTTTTGGTKAGANSAGISGTVPDGCTVTLASTGVTCTVSVVTKTVPCLVAQNGGWVAQLVSQKILRLALSGTSSGVASNSVLIPAPISPVQPAGSMFEGSMYAKLTANDLTAAPAAPINIGLGAGSGTAYTWSNATTKTNSGFIADVVEGIMRGWVRATTGAVGSTSLFFQFRLSAGAVDCTIDLAMPYVRAVSRTARSIPMAVHNSRDDLTGPVVGPRVGNATTWTATHNVVPAAIQPGEAWKGDGITFTFQGQTSSDKAPGNIVDKGSPTTSQTPYTPQTGDGYVRYKVIGTNSFGPGYAYTAWSTNSI